MKTVAVMSLTPGMVLGEDLVFQNRVVFPAGTTLDKLKIDKINHYSVMCVTIMEEVDFATTHYEKIRFDESFRRFERNYFASLMKYKKLMISFLQSGIPVPDEALLQIYDSLWQDIPSGAVLLDYLYNMMPNEDELTFSHCLNSALLAGAVADWVTMNQQDKQILILCGFYYDIGKLKLPYDLLWKPSKLTDDEFRMVQTHPVIGYAMIKNTPLNNHIKNAVIMHHERLDGTGYPYHMQGTNIDAYARYIAIIDAYIAMASPRSYRNAFTPLQILARFEEDMSKFDVQLLMPVMKRIADAQIGTKVQTNDEKVWEVMIIHPNKFSRPILRNDNNELLDMLQHPETEIVKMM